VLNKRWRRLLLDFAKGCKSTSLIRYTPPYDPTVAPNLVTYGGPRGVSFSCERGTPLGRGRCCWIPNRVISK
jgi:hypothetical protein